MHNEIQIQLLQFLRFAYSMKNPDTHVADILLTVQITSNT